MGKGSDLRELIIGQLVSARKAGCSISAPTKLLDIYRNIVRKELTQYEIR